VQIPGWYAVRRPGEVALNQDVIDLYDRVKVGTRVVVLPKNAPLMARGGDTVRRPVSKRPAATTLPSGRQAMSISISTVN